MSGTDRIIVLNESDDLQQIVTLERNNVKSSEADENMDNVQGDRYGQKGSKLKDQEELIKDAEKRSILDAQNQLIIDRQKEPKSKGEKSPNLIEEVEQSQKIVIQYESKLNQQKELSLEAQKLPLLGTQKKSLLEIKKGLLPEIDLKSQKSISSDDSLTMHVEASDVIPDVAMAPVSASHLPIVIKIPMYKTSSFMKMETQTYLIDVINLNIRSEYQIRRRFSDFVDLYDSLFHLHPGHILCPFPDKNFESFMQIKLGIGVNEASERSQLIQKRMAKLQKFINFVTHHPKLQQCQQIEVFLQRDQMKYEQMRAQIENQVKQRHNLTVISYLTSLREKSKKMWSYFRKQNQEKTVRIRLRKNDLQFCRIMQIIERSIAQNHKKIKLAEKLSQIELNFAEFVDFPTDNDILLVMCAKHSSGREYCRNFHHVVEISIVDELKEVSTRLFEIKKILDYRNQLLEAVQHASKYELKEKAEQILFRVEELEITFLSEWEVEEPKTKEKIQSLLLHFRKQWKMHKRNMRKIWRKK